MCRQHGQLIRCPQLWIIRRGHWHPNKLIDFAPGLCQQISTLISPFCPRRTSQEITSCFRHRTSLGRARGCDPIMNETKRRLNFDETERKNIEREEELNIATFKHHPLTFYQN